MNKLTEKDLSVLRGRIRNVCDIYEVTDNLLNSISAVFDKSKIVWDILKRDEEIKLYINDMDAAYIIFNNIFRLQHRLEKEKSDNTIVPWKFSDVAGETEIIELAESVAIYITSLPHKYDIYFQLPSVEGFGETEINITDNVSLIEITKESVLKIQKSRGLLEIFSKSMNPNLGFKENSIYLKIKTVGYGSCELRASAVLEGMSIFKQFIQLSTSSNIFTVGKPSNVESGVPTRVEIQMYNTEYNDDEFGIFMPASMSDYISKLSVNPNTLKPVSRGIISAVQKKDVPLTQEKKIEMFVSKFGKIDSLFNNPSDKDAADAIRAATEWAFDSRTSENDTLSMVNAFIGLEAILGEDIADDVPNTKTLADRCGYLLGKNFSDRKDIKNKFLNLYKIRSKISHGRIRRLKGEESIKLRYAQNLLDKVIETELNKLRKIGSLGALFSQ